MVVETQYGFHIVQITNQSKASKKVQVAIVSRKVVPSTKTYQQIYSSASIFAGINNTKDKFEKSIIRKGLNKKIGSFLKKAINNSRHSQWQGSYQMGIPGKGRGCFRSHRTRRSFYNCCFNSCKR